MSESITFLLVIVIGCLGILGAYYIGCQHEQEMAKLGYIEVQSVGTSTRLWVKP